VDASYTGAMEKRNPAMQIVYPLRISIGEYKRLKALAREEDLNGAQFIRRSIRQAIERRQKRARTAEER